MSTIGLYYCDTQLQYRNCHTIASNVIALRLYKFQLVQIRIVYKLFTQFTIVVNNCRLL